MPFCVVASSADPEGGGQGVRKRWKISSYITLVNVYVDLVVFTRIDGTS